VAGPEPRAPAQTRIAIESARAHNLQGVSCTVPLRALTVVTGVSGSGKSSLAFDTLYAEGQRRYVTSLSTYARQFLERLARPEVDHISNLPPAIAIEQHNRVTNARSTVGTATELLDHLRLLYARVGETVCPDCERTVRACSPSELAAELAAEAAAAGGRRLVVGVPLERRGRQPLAELRDAWVREGYRRVWTAAEGFADWSELPARGIGALLRAGALLVVDRVAVRGDAERTRLAEALAAGFRCGGGRLVALDADAPDAPRTCIEGFACDGCGRRFPAPTPPLFSFNSPIGACETCSGFGRIQALDWDRVIPDPRRSLRDGAVAPFTTSMGRSLQRDLLECCEDRGVDPDTPYGALSAGDQDWVREGDDAWYGVRGFFDWLERRRFKVQARVLIARYRRFDPCPDCEGGRLGPAARCVRVAGEDLGTLSRRSLADLESWVEALDLPEPRRAASERLRALLLARLRVCNEVGLGYLSLDRTLRTLSGGEAQRIQLGTALSGRLTGTLYVLDEPSIGLHARDLERLVGVLQRIRDQGNTVVVVEHALEVVRAADHVIDLGPGAGRHGGRLLVEGPPAAVAAEAGSATGRALAAPPAKPPARRTPADAGALRIVGAREHNLRDLDVEIPLRRLVVLTGVSGAGKSTLIERCLVPGLRAKLAEGEAPEPGDYDRIEGAEAIERVVVVDQRPATRSPRSNPATVSRAFEGIRKRFAATREAKAEGVAPGFFSFNVAGGRCERCEGSGELVIDMQFLDDVRVPCDDCGGRRYRAEALRLTLDGRSIADVLDLSIEEACEVFAGDRRIADRLAPFVRAGLGYLQLGQPLSTLSGGEHQRVRIAQALQEGGEGTLYVLDEPTTGLHPADVEVLLESLDQLLADGGSVLLVEHHLDVIARADHVIDLGPEGGPGGGRLVAAGPPEAVAAVRDSHTGAALRAHEARAGRPAGPR